MAETTTAAPVNLDDLVSEIVERKKRSQMWLESNYWSQWIQAYKNYKCERDPAKDEEDPAKDDNTQTAVGMPDTWSLVRRGVARITAQPPSLKFRSDDEAIAARISHTLSWAWDKGKTQRTQKKHVTQAMIFGWSVRAWYWCVDESMRKRRIDPFSEKTDPKDLEMLHKQYMGKLQEYAAQGIQDETEMMTKLIGEVGRGNLVAVQYLQKRYEGPKSEFLFIGDCYPEPSFTTLQTSNDFIVVRRRNRAWLDKLVELYPNFKQGVLDLYDKHPNGSPRNTQSKTPKELRNELLAAASQTDVQAFGQDSKYTAKEWTIVERHVPGVNPTLAYVAEDSVGLGIMPHPYDLEGMIPFTELVFIDDMLAGIGDSNARIIRGLQELNNRNSNQRSDLVYNLSRPLYGTSNDDLYADPSRLQRGKGFRLIELDKQGDLWPIGEQAAQAGAIASISEDSSIGRNIQIATGESNMSLAANVDPQQARTATGARIMAYAGDVLSKDAIDMYTYAMAADLEMMYLLFRSEMAEPVKFDATPYVRRQIAAPADQQAPPSPLMVDATPEDFQSDGDVEAEVGSTLADDDDQVLSKAQSIFQTATQYPQLFNVERARNDYLVAMGKGKDLQAYLPAPSPPEPPPPPKASGTVSIKLEVLPLPAQIKVLNELNFPVTPEDMMPGLTSAPGSVPAPGAGPQAPGLPPPLPPNPAVPGMVPDSVPAPVEPPLLGASAGAAASGHSPFGH